jgi:drug/metabolite transporter (DMT)-like permease
LALTLALLLLSLLYRCCCCCSLQATSLAHSLLLVSTSPVINVGVALVMRHAISAGEIAGSVLALVGTSWVSSTGCISTL